MANALDRGWYVVHTQSGYEDRVHRLLLQRIATEKLQDKIFNVMIPTEEVVEVKKTKKKISKRKFFPGYVLLDMKVDEQTYWFVKTIPGVSGFLGEPRPAPLPEEEVRGIIDLTTTAAESKPRPAVQFEKGENIRIIEGPFRHFVGIVEEVNEAKAKIKAMVTIFGRPTPVELDFLQVEKL
ncbi:MAG: transcription termination/antitermination factor NusG [Elusimicrobia bacterium]|nr:transcription termination/antitermination factor NusG [Elusimicrobiota bacterium]MDE2236961.1 transcription termination/antitermination factor NusG [Elusimicrobiota bacterium]MDE2425432.1 transcription termination/antitermination factor NusG [Elusimicrobiota bacterium]